MISPNYRTTLSGAVGTLGTALFGAPIILSVAGVDFPKTLIITLMTAGFVLTCIGKALQALFSADAKDTKQQVDELHSRVDQVSSDTQTIKRQQAENSLQTKG